MAPASCYLPEGLFRWEAGLRNLIRVKFLEICQSKISREKVMKRSVSSVVGFISLSHFFTVWPQQTKKIFYFYKIFNCTKINLLKRAELANRKRISKKMRVSFLPISRAILGRKPDKAFACIAPCFQVGFSLAPNNLSHGKGREGCKMLISPSFSSNLFGKQTNCK